MASYVMQQLAYVGPVLIVYVVGMILSLVFIGRYRLPAVLALAGTLILFLTSIGVVATQGYVFNMRVTAAWSLVQYSQINAIVSVISTVLRVLGTALLVAAVFSGRKSRAPSEA